MGIIDKLKSWAFGGQQTYSLNGPRLDANGMPYFWPISFDGYSWNDRNFDEFVHAGYGRNPYVFMVADKLGQLVANLPIMLADEEGEALAELPILAAPNEHESRQEFIYRAVVSYLITGNAIIYARRPVGFSQIAALQVALTQDTQITTDSGADYGQPLYYDIQYEGRFDAADVLHIKKPNLLRNTIWGLSPLYSGQSLYEGSNNTFKAAASIHKNRGASGVLSPKNSDDMLLPDEQRQLQAGWDFASSGPEKLGKIHVTTAAMDYLKIGMDANDLRLIEFNIEYLRTICSLFGVDSSLFNDPANKTYNNRKEAQKALYTDTVLPLAKDIYGQLSAWLIQESLGIDGQIQVITDGIEALQEDATAKHARIHQDLSAGVISAEEARAILYPEL